MVIDIADLVRHLDAACCKDPTGSAAEGLFVYFGGVQPDRVRRTEPALETSDGRKLVLDHDADGRVCRIELI
jgi:hypothetical protein